MAETRTMQICLGRYSWIRGMLEKGIPLNCTEIAERLGITPKSAQRYVNRLRADGYEIEYTPKLRGYRMTRPLERSALVTLAEAYAWARDHNITAPWVTRAGHILKGGH